MLILRRKAGESLLIGDEVKLTVMDVGDGGVRLAIDAPRRISVLRSELVQAADANRAAADGGSRPQALLGLLGHQNPAEKKETVLEKTGAVLQAREQEAAQS